MKARVVFNILLANGWIEVSRESSHIKLFKRGIGNFIFSFSMNEDIGLKMISKISSKTKVAMEEFSKRKGKK